MVNQAILTNAIMARPRQITDEQILATMRACVLQHGPAVSLDLVAEKLNVTSPALIKRFGTRRALMIAALKPSDDNAWTRILAKGPDARPLLAQLEEVVGAFLEAFHEAMPCMHALRESGIPMNEIFDRREDPPPVRAIRQLAKWLGDAHALGVVRDDGDHETAATALVGAVSTRTFTAHLTQTPWSAREQREYGRQLAELFTRALSPVSRTPSRTLQ